MGGIFTLDLGDEPGTPPSVRSSVVSMTSDQDPVVSVAVPVDMKRADDIAKGRVARPITISNSMGVMRNRSAAASASAILGTVLSVPQADLDVARLFEQRDGSDSDETIDCGHGYPRGDRVAPSREELAEEAAKWQYDKPVVSPEDHLHEVDGPDVTVGIEWEFFIDPQSSPYGDMDKVPDTGYPAPVVTRPGTIENLPQVYHVAKALNDANIRAATRCEVQYALVNPTYAALRFPDVDHLKIKNDRFSEYFIVGVDASVRDDGLKMEKEKWKSVEIASAVVTAKRLGEVEKAFEIILETFHVKTNDSYGLHVHVGNGTQGFSNVWMRSTAALVWAAAPLFDGFHPVFRGPCDGHIRSIRYFSEAATDGQTLRVDVGDEDPGNLPITHTFDVAKGAAIAYHIPNVRPGRPDVAYEFGPQARDPLSRPQKMGVREAAPIQAYLERDGLCPQCPADPHMGWHGVVRFLHSPTARNTLSLLRNAATMGGRMNYNFDNLRRQSNDACTRPRTIEFRQHAGTTDIFAITHWARVCAAIVSVARPIKKAVDASDKSIASPSVAEDADHGLANNPKVAVLAHKAIEGTLQQTTYDVYNFMVDIGAIVSFHYYLRGFPVYNTLGSGSGQASGLLIAIRDKHRIPADRLRGKLGVHQVKGAIKRRARRAGRAVKEFAAAAATGVKNKSTLAFQTMNSCFK
ncbi:uncharacterized protein SPSK_07165 [Sporothrix schenckii 1099-18]|uniref:Amidoligase enzyme n=1 Tax=Sporothrix schenckii 1099-18 TaxID=1397361 RepID=A0A0F2MG33_SPOSC|nr:uncharacterized protein SPSK_07165 [Sporothrix schenckii 1099-18]KJR88582.1 hypothetical protein SPSK_07165 [Sporothrix schenckii 1099-18]